VSFAAITLCVASQQVIPEASVYFIIELVRRILDTPSYVPPEHDAIKAYRRSGSTAPRVLDLGTYWEVSGQLHAPAALP
jgi:hypothetical protein